MTAESEDKEKEEDKEETRDELEEDGNKMEKGVSEGRRILGLGLVGLK